MPEVTAAAVVLSSGRSRTRLRTLLSAFSTVGRKDSIRHGDDLSIPAKAGALVGLSNALYQELLPED